MELCSDGHNEVCFEGRDCPICLMVNDYEQQIYDLRYTIDILEDEVKDLKMEADNG